MPVTLPHRVVQRTQAGGVLTAGTFLGRQIKNAGWLSLECTAVRSADVHPQQHQQRLFLESVRRLLAMLRRHDCQADPTPESTLPSEHLALRGSASSGNTFYKLAFSQ